MTTQTESENNNSATGRTPSDAAVEIIKLLGGAAPYLVILAMIIYGAIQYSERSDKLNKMLLETANSIADMNKTQMDNVKKSIELQQEVFENQKKFSAIKAESEETIKKLESQKKLFIEESKKRDDQILKLNGKIEELQKKELLINNITEQAVRLANYISNASDDLSYSNFDISYLAEKFENGDIDSSRVSQDLNGIFYYGIYRLTGNNIKDFIIYLKKRNLEDYFTRLTDVGGENGAKQGSEQFTNSWKSLSQDEGFNFVQKEFIKEHEYQFLIERLEKNKSLKKFNINILKRSVALQAVIFSVALQHGRYTNLIADSFLSNPKGTDKELINIIFDKRKNFDIYLDKNLDENTKKLLTVRYKLEEREALKMLKIEQNNSFNTSTMRSKK